jgi:hypothetical protein
MAVSSVLPLSTCDIHLLLTGGSTSQMVVVADNTTNNISADPNTSLVGFNASVVTASAVGGASPHIEFTAHAVGESIGKVRHVDTSVVPNAVFEFLVRVRVHQSLTDFWIGNNQVTLHQGMDNYVLSVYAKFSDGTRGDISGHPYVTYASNNPAVTVDAVGRLTGVSMGAADISVTVGGVTKPITALVVVPVTTDRAIVRRLHGNGLFTERRNILLLAEGFSSRADFDRIAAEITNRLMNTVAHSPYNALRDSFNVWAAFEPQAHPSPEDGITFCLEVKAPVTPAPRTVPVGNPIPPSFENPLDIPGTGVGLVDLVPLVGLPTSWLPNVPATLAAAKTAFGALRNFDGTTATLPNTAAITQDMFDAWLELRDHAPLQARNSRLGFSHGSRLGERRAVRGIIPHRNLWYIPEVPHRSLKVDERRRQPFNFFTFTNEFFKSLKMQGVPLTDPNYNLGPTWAAGGADSGLACMIINDEYLGGAQVRTGTTPPLKFFSTTVNVNSKLDVPAPTPAGSTVLNHRAANAAAVPYEKITVVLAHELAHSLNLLDEYEGVDDPSHTDARNAPAPELQQLHDSSNAAAFQDVESVVTPGRVDPHRAKWNLDRIEQADVLVAPATGAGSIVTVTLKAGRGARWQAAKTANRGVFLRHPDLTRDPTFVNDAALGPLTVDSITGDTLALKATGIVIITPLRFPAGSTLYLPRLDKSGQVLRVIHPAVIAHIAANGPFAPHAGNCGKPDTSRELPPASIANFSLPRVAYETVGLYEGGGTWTCGAYRPCGTCRMREFEPLAPQQLRFCFVCKYMLVNLIDPSVHDVIDRLYP